MATNGSARSVTRIPILTRTASAPVIAVVDDRATNRAVLGRLAASLGPRVQVRPFDNPVDALDWLTTSDVDLVITDFKMPAMNGADFIRKLRALPNCYDVPVVVVTVYEERELRYKALDAGATDFLISPLDHREFRARVSNLLMLRQQQEIIRRRAASLEERLHLTNQMRADENRLSNLKINTIIDALPAIVTVQTAAGVIVLANRACRELFGPDVQVVGRSWNDLRSLVEGRDHSLHDERIRRGELGLSFEEEMVDAGGRRAVFMTSKVPLRLEPGAEAHILTVSWDITDRKQVEHQLLAAKTAAEAANRSKNEFLANTSHELRTPLNAIIGFAEIIASELLGPVGNERYQEYSKDIVSSARLLLQLIDDILDISQLEGGRLSLNETWVDVGTVVASVAAGFALKADECQIRFEVEVDDTLMLFADERRVKQILNNLLSNAFKFTPPDGTVRLEAVSDLPDASVTFRVIDTGVGIAERDMATALARFGRIGHSKLAAPPGGTLVIESEVGVGTRVSVSFPRERGLWHGSVTSSD
jgi:two-component system cell cycle sensor histidine kinase PleC